MRIALLISLVLVLAVAPAASAAPRPCSDLRGRVVDVAIDYALARSAEGSLAEAPDLYIDVTVERCRRRSPRRAVWSFRLRIRDTEMDLVTERGTIEVTPRRSWLRLRPSRADQDDAEPLE